MASYFPLNSFNVIIFVIRLRKEMGNVPKRHQPDQRTENILRQPMGRQRSEKIPHPDVGLRWLITNIIFQLGEMDAILNQETCK